MLYGKMIPLNRFVFLPSQALVFLRAMDPDGKRKMLKLIWTVTELHGLVTFSHVISNKVFYPS